ncbi:MAG: M28 family peptidase [Anaerolineae bacterium]|nr:M28 family peptidase [Gemmatimonadaceae bacterium]
MRALAIAMALATTAACDGERSGPRTSFSAEAAMGYIKTQLDFGPRIPGSIGHRRAGDWIVAQARARADTVTEQRWTHVTEQGDTLPLRNIFARFRPEASERILYVAHWDTRPTSESASDPLRRKLPVPGANDGASGVALLLALADVLKATPPTVGVDLLFVDGEDYGDFPRGKDVLLGSKYFAANLPAPSYRPLFGIVWDMIGDASLQIYQEGHSVQRAPEVVSRVWDVASRFGYSEWFIPRVGQFITDDHIPLLDAGLRVIDVIDIDYQPYHHTPEDTYERVSKESMQRVGDVATALVVGSGG